MTMSLAFYLDLATGWAITDLSRNKNSDLKYCVFLCPSLGLATSTSATEAGRKAQLFTVAPNDQKTFIIFCHKEMKDPRADTSKFLQYVSTWVGLVETSIFRLFFFGGLLP